MNPSQKIRRLQTNLKREGFDPGAIDGKPGPNTTKAVNLWKVREIKRPNGIDVSRWNTTLNFDELVSLSNPMKIEFIYIKATDGTGKDRLFDHHWSEAGKVGLFRGAYHWFHPSQSIEAQAEAIFRAVGVLRPGDLPVAIDVERDDKGADGKLGTRDDVKASDAQIEKFANLVANKTGRRPLIYSYEYYLDDRDIEIPSCFYWAADYREGPPSLPPGFPRAIFHQYGVGEIEGVQGLCDLNRFQGTDDELKTLAGF